MAGTGVVPVPQLGWQGLAGIAPASVLRERLDGSGGQSPFPVAPPLAPLLPGGGLRRGSVVVVYGSAALLLALLATATTQGAWAAVVGVGDLGMLAAVEAGVAVPRLALVPRAGPDLAAVLAVLLDGVGLVAVAGADRLSARTRRALAARARQRGTVLLSLDPWQGADVELHCRTEKWHGVEAGYGRLHSREVVVHVSGRGAATRQRTARLLLPGPGGPVAQVQVPAVATRPITVVR